MFFDFFPQGYSVFFFNFQVQANSIFSLIKYKKVVFRIKIYLVKKTKIKKQNKYIFRIIISEFLYFFI